MSGFNEPLAAADKPASVRDGSRLEEFAAAVLDRAMRMVGFSDEKPLTNEERSDALFERVDRAAAERDANFKREFRDPLLASVEKGSEQPEVPRGWDKVDGGAALSDDHRLAEAAERLAARKEAERDTGREGR
jgi:hypothetical protein